MSYKPVITTADSRRLEKWEKLFGERTEQLPVLSSEPRWIEHRAKVGTTAVSVPVYDLDASRLTIAQRRTFAKHIAKAESLPFDVAYLQVHAYPIKAAGCELVETAVCG